jgi:SAM-dependent methyltransferase
LGSRKRSLITECICGAEVDGSYRGRRQHGIEVFDCRRCAATIQKVRLSEEELATWYRESYSALVYTHTPEHDAAVADLRIKAYGDKLRGSILDVGCGNAAFVTACKNKGLDAVGQEIGEVPEAAEWYVHSGDLFEIGFPTDFYDAVTCHDVLEHVVDPERFLRELRRILKPGGWFILDWPDFEFPHHWKATEHIWLLTGERVALLLEQADFEVVYRTRPVDSKLVFYSTKRKENRPSILLPPGIGDSYWSIVKLPGFMKRELGVEVVDLYVSDPDDKQRSLDWVRKISWASAVGYVRHSVQSSEFQEAYMQDGRYLFERVAGCDYFMAFNGVMRFGKDIDKIETAWGSDWFPRLFRSKAEEQAEGVYRDRFGPYVVAYFVEHGMYRKWLDELPVQKIAETLRGIKERGIEVVFMGARWDRNGLPGMLAGAIGGVDLCGETSIDEMFALLRGSRGVIGWPAGNTIMATVLKKQTLLFWNRYFDERFWGLSCPPASRRAWYFWQSTAKPIEAEVAAWVERISP